MNRTADALIIPYVRKRTLELVLSLSGYEADKDAYLEAKGILERAIAALDDRPYAIEITHWTPLPCAPGKE